MAKARELEQSLQRAEAQLYLFRRISRQLAKAQPMGDALQNIVGLVADFMSADSCLLYLAGDDDLVLVAARDPRPAAIGSVKVRFNEGLTGWVAHERRLLAISREAYNDTRFKFFRDLPEDAYEAFLSAPVVAQGRVLGVINVQHRSAHSHTGDEMEALTAVGELVGCLVTMARAADEPGVNFAELALRTIPAQAE